MDGRVSVRCREADVDLVRRAIPLAVERFDALLAAAPGAAARLKIDASVSAERLPKEGAGGVIVTSLGGRIACDNTLEQRLDVASAGMLPALRVALFGASASRKFFD